MHTRLIFLLLAPLTLSANICYYPDGSTSKDVPCDADAPVTQCCGTRSACLTNGLCALTATNSSGSGYARGTCTDKSWASSLCPQQCQLNQDTPTNTSAYDFRASGVMVWQCGSEGYARDAKFCCESEAESKRCCSTETAVFTLLSAQVGASTSVSVTSSSVSLVASSRRASSTGPAVTSGVESSPTGSPAPSKEGKGNNKAVGIGAGVGGALAGCILVAVVVFCVRKHKKKQKGNGTGASELYGAAMQQENKHPVELSTHPVELPPNPQMAWELPANVSGRTSRIVG
jgi:hypothetical protein